MRSIIVFIVLFLIGCQDRKDKVSISSEVKRKSLSILEEISSFEKVDTSNDLVVLRIKPSHSIKNDLFIIDIDQLSGTYYSRREKLFQQTTTNDDKFPSSFSTKEQVSISVEEVKRLKECLVALGMEIEYKGVLNPINSAKLFFKFDGHEYFNMLDWSLGSYRPKDYYDTRPAIAVEECFREVFSSLQTTKPTKQVRIKKNVEKNRYSVYYGLTSEHGSFFNYHIEKVLKAEILDPYFIDPGIYQESNATYKVRNVLPKDTTALCESIEIICTTYAGDTVVF